MNEDLLRLLTTLAVQALSAYYTAARMAGMTKEQIDEALGEEAARFGGNNPNDLPTAEVKE